MLTDVVGVGFLQVEKILVFYALLVGPSSFADIALQFVYRGMQVDQQVGLHDLLVDDVEDLLIEPEFLLGKVHLGEKKALGEQVIRDGDLLKEVLGMDQLLQLFESLGHEKQFHRESVLAGVLIKLAQKGIVGKFLQDQPRIVMTG